jgi:alkyl hydroperoxide reductase subunit AhpC
LNALQQRFAGGKAQVVGILCDSVYTLKAWAESLGGVEYPLCSDHWPHGQVSQAYGVFNEELGRPERAIIVVDAEGICRYIDVHTLREVPDEEEIAEELTKLT